MRCGWVSSGVAADSDIRKVLRKGQWQLGIFELQNSGKLITGSGLFHLTSAFRISNSWIWSLQQLMAVRRQRLRLDTMCWSAASSTLGCKVWSCAVQMLEDMQLAALQLDLRRVSPHGIWQRAWHSLFEVRLLGLQCDVVAMNAHLAAGNWEKTNGLLYHMRVSELYPDAVTRTILVSQCSWEAALEVLWESPQMLRDQIAVGSVLTTLAKGARWQLALALIKDVKASSLQPDTVSIQLVVQSCEKASLWGAAVELMSRQVESVSSVMKAAQQALCWQVASQMLQLMKDSDIRADVVCYNCLMGPPPRQWPYVLMILAGLRVKAVRSTDYSLSSAVSALEAASNWSVALTLMCRQMSLPSFNALLSGCTWRLTMQLLDEFPTLRGMVPDAISFGTAISGEDLPWEKAIQLKRQLWQSHHSDSVAAAALMTSMAQRVQWRSALSCVRTVQDGYEAALISACHWQTSLFLLQSLPSPLINDITFTAAITACEKSLTGRLRSAWQ